MMAIYKLNKNTIGSVNNKIHGLESAVLNSADMDLEP